MDQRRVHYLFAALSFLIALITYGLTMQPTIPFWDCGEFAAAAIGLGVPHPPGAPLWTIVGRLGMLIPIFTDPTARYNFLSVLSSAISIMLLYLTIVRLIKIWRGTPRTMADMLTHYGGAFVGALAYCFTDSFWFNALECEVYAFGSLFISLVPWLIMVWYDHADEPHSEKYLMLIAYVIGLSLGVHQLALLTIFPVWMLVYYKRWPKTTVMGWIIMVVTSVLAFGFIFLIVLSDLVDWAGKGKGILSVLILAGMIGGIFYGESKKKPFLTLGLWGSMLIFLGYTTYAVIMVRGAQDPPMNQHHASTFAVLSEYINREQYGEAKEMPRRLEEQNRDHSHDATFNNYSSDWDFFWRYQTGHMFTRYLGWNFIGRESDEQDAGVDWKKTFGLPFFLGIFGLFWHFRRDPKRALTLVGTFIIMGFLTAWYQNQQDPQPRERDYFYVGAFYIYAMWVGIGATGVLEWLRSRFGSKALTEASMMTEEERGVPVIKGDGNVGVLGLGLAGLLVLVPLNQCIGLTGLLTGESLHDSSKWGEYSRWHNYVPYEYAYNFLQSCDKDAILFTAGDNDTFPLWCLQDVYGIRRDVRIVNLSLGNMSWYIRQLKYDKEWGVGLPIELPSFTEEKMSHPDESEGGLQATAGPAADYSFDVAPQTMAKFTGVAQPGKMTWKFTGQFPREGGYVFTIADQLIRDIVQYNLDKRPIYFATLVPPSYMAGLDSHLRYEGLAARVVPTSEEGNSRTMDVSVNEPLYRQVALANASQASLTPSRPMILNSYRDPAANLSAMDERYSQTYYYMYFRLADWYIRNNRLQDAKTTMDTCEARLPPLKLHPQYRYADLFAERYQEVGDSAKARKYAHMAVEDMRTEPQDQSEGDQSNVTQLYHLAQVYLSTGQLDSAHTLFQQLYNNVQGQDKMVMQYKLLAVEAKQLQAKGDKHAEYDKLHTIVMQFGALNGSAFASEYPLLAARYQQLHTELNIKDSVAQPATPAAPGKPAKPGTQPSVQMHITPGMNH